MHVYRWKTRSGTSNSGGRRCGDDSARNPDFFTDDARSVSLTVSASSSPSSSRMTSRRRTLRTCSGASSSRFGEEAPLGASATHSSFARPAVRPTRRSARTRPTPRPTRPTSPSGRRLRRRPTPRSSRWPSAAPAPSRRSRSSTPRRSKLPVCFGARVYDQVDEEWKADGATGDWTLRTGEGAVRKGVASSFGSSFREFLQFEPRFVVFRTASGVGFPNFTLSGLWISREQEPSVAFHHLDFFLLVAFSRGLHESFSTCLAKDTTLEATSSPSREPGAATLHAQLLVSAVSFRSSAQLASLTRVFARLQAAVQI